MSFQPFLRKRTRLLACFGMTCVVLLASRVLHSRTLTEFYNIKANIHAKVVEPSDELIVLAIDENAAMDHSIHGAWPWPRFVHAGIGEYCKLADVVAFDVFFPNTDNKFSDELFANAVKTLREDSDCHMITVCDFRSNAHLRPVPKTFYRFCLDGNPDEVIPEAVRYKDSFLPYALLRTNSTYIAHGNYPRERYGQYNLALRWGDKMVPSLALSTIMARENLLPNALALDGSRRLSQLPQALKMSREGNVYYPVSQRKFQTITATDLFNAIERDTIHPGLSSFHDAATAIEHGINTALRNDEFFDPHCKMVFNRFDFKNKIVLVGSNATGLFRDFEDSPLGEATAGVFIHAAMIDNLLNGHQFWMWPWALSALPIFLLGILPAFMTNERPQRLFLGALAVLLLYFALTIFLNLKFGWLLPWLWPTLALVLSTVVAATFAWMAEQFRRRELEAMDAAKQQFTDMLVHDLKGRVSNMVMSTSLLERKIPEEVRPVKLISTISSSGSRLLTQVNALLDIRKIEEGRMQLETRPCNVADLIRDAVREYQPSASLINLELVTELDPELKRPVRLDPDIFQRILANLVWNALQYADRGTKVVVGTRDVRGEAVEVYVANRGKSIPSHVVDELFTPFESGPNTDKNVKSVSTGLGLAFCRLAAEAHGGIIDIESPWREAGDGVRVVVTI